MNDSTYETDSTYVTNSNYSTQGIGDDGKHEYSFDIISIYYSSKSLIHTEIHKGCNQDQTVVYYELNSGQLTLVPYQIAYIEGISEGTSCFPPCGWQGSEFTFEIINSLILNNMTYSHVIHSTYKKQYHLASQIQNYSWQFFFAKNVGLIKYQSLTNDTIQSSWSLKRYKVNQ